MLSLIDATVVASITSKQAARALLKHQTDLVLGMKQEGLLNPSDASGLLDSIATDMTRVEKDTKTKLRHEYYLLLVLCSAVHVSVFKCKIEPLDLTTLCIHLNTVIIVRWY
jgi:hypothetical protein